MFRFQELIPGLFRRSIAGLGIPLLLCFIYPQNSQAVGIRVASSTDAYVYISVTNVNNTCLFNKDQFIKYYLDGVLTEPDIRDHNAAMFFFDNPEETHTIYATVEFSGTWCSYSETTETDIFELKPLSNPKDFSASDLDYTSSIILTWNSSTYFSDESYDIYLNGSTQALASISSADADPDGNFKFTHSNLEPGEKHSYIVKTRVNGISSSGVSAGGSTFDFDFQASTDDQFCVNLTWNDASPLVKNVNGYIVKRMKEGVEYEVYQTELNSSTAYEDKNEDLMPGYYYTYILRTLPDEDLVGSIIGRLLPDGQIIGEVKTPPTIFNPDGVGVPGVLVTATRKGTVPTDTTSKYHTHTREDGSYTIPNIYYYNSSTFTVRPLLEGHYFDPVKDEATLPWNGSNSITGVNFEDTSSFVLSGIIMQETDKGICSLEGVSILVDGEDSEIRTDETGRYDVTVSQANDYTITPHLEGHEFDPGELHILVTTDTAGLDFRDTSSYLVEGYLAASCNIYIGQASIGFYSLDEESCYSDTVTTIEGSGFFSIELPARDYRIEVLSFTSEDENLVSGASVMAYFTTDTICLNENKSLDFIYRLKPELSLDSLGETFTCGETQLPILEQYKEYELNFGISETFGDHTCPADTGYIVVEQTITGDDIRSDTIFFRDGSATMTLVPGEPNLIAPYEKWIRTTVHLDRKSDTLYHKVLVVGYKPRGDKPFTTVTPSLPFLIVHDPPGGGSYSYFESNTSVENAMSISAQKSIGGKYWARLKLGLAYSVEAGVGVDFAIWNENFASSEVTAEWIDHHSINYAMTNSREYRTSNNTEIHGNEGDVFIGGAMNMLYTQVDAISYNNQSCQAERNTDIVMIPEGFKTTFMYTEQYIREVHIPDLERILEDYQETDEDSVFFYQNQISVWQQMLENNQRNIANAKTDKRNISFSSALAYKDELVESSKSTSTYEFKQVIDQKVATEVGFEFAGSGLGAGVEVSFRTEMGNVHNTSYMNTYKTGYELADPTTGDVFTVDVLKDPVYGTPAFRLIGGRSSCPWEPGTQAREGVQLLADRYSQVVEQEDGEAVFRLQMANLSQSDEDKIYHLVFDQSSNPDGAELSIGSGPVVVPYEYLIPSGGSLDATITVKKGPLVSTYQDLRFVLKSPCDENIYDDVYLNVSFPGNCGNLNLHPEDVSTMLNLASEGVYVFTVDGYNASVLESLALQISPAGSFAWTTIATFPASDLDEIGMEIPLSFYGQEDGIYKVRAAAICPGDLFYSNDVELLVDQTPPELFGVPQPASGVLDTMQNISLLFTEDIDCSSIEDGCINMILMDANIELDCEVGCQGNTLIMMPENPSEVLNGDQVHVEVHGIRDLAGNMLQDTISWQFQIPDAAVLQVDGQADFDMDGILNESDNCYLTANPGQEDLDEDGEGNSCDEDMDGDQILNEEDNCSMSYNPDQTDKDNNGIGDACEMTSDNSLILSNLEINIYPNPVQSEFICELSVLKPSRLRFEIRTLTGQLIQLWPGKDYPAGTWLENFRTDGMVPGIYVVRIYVDNMVYSRCLVKL